MPLKHIRYDTDKPTGQKLGSAVMADIQEGIVIPDPDVDDTQVAQLVSDPASETKTTLDATYAPAFADTGITYDGSGNVETVTENGVTTTYTYNPDGSVATDTRLGITRTYTYDGSGNLTGIAS